MEFREFPKIARLSREVIVTEKIDGTNASVYFEQVAPEALTADHPNDAIEAGWLYIPQASLRMRVGSRTQWITPSNDNHGFARWAYANAVELAGLGAGHHFGEWWGQGIQRKYDLTEKRFSLFNVSRWIDPWKCAGEDVEGRTVVPSCCTVVPVLLKGPFLTGAIDVAIDLLRERGSYAAPGFMKPEGIVVFHTAANLAFKKTLEKDDVPKALLAKAA